MFAGEMISIKATMRCPLTCRMATVRWRPRKSPSKSAAYYCPMCEGVESDRPGTCPKCGMALEVLPESLENLQTLLTKEGIPFKLYE